MQLTKTTSPRWLSLGISAVFLVWNSMSSAISIVPTKNDKILAQTIARELERRHLAADSLFADRKRNIGSLIIDSIDSSRSFLIKTDLDELDLNALPEQLKNGQLEEIYSVYSQFFSRSEERLKFWLNLLNTIPATLNLTDNERLLFRNQNTPWLTNLDELKQLWRKQLENQAINLLLADKTNAEMVKTLTRRYESQLNRLNQTRADDIFSAVINAYSKVYDPHTSYLPPADSETFNINMSLQLQGIGAVLQTENEFTKVVSLIPGGPAEMDGRLQPADRILGVGQNGNPIEDVVGWRLDEVVQRIRGPKGSRVRLEIQSGDDAPHREIILVRDTVQLEEQSAKSDIVTIADPNGKDIRIGIITIPTFYSNFAAKQAGDPNYRSTTRDVRRILKELKAERVKGIVIDLRDNGGGSLQEAYELFGLFINRGPVVQIRSAGGRTDVRGDRNPEIAWDGPLVALVNRLSASASEIFAGALQDYGRGLVIGSQTFGKGTVQALLPVNKGQLKLTIAKFYRISGESTQNKGVIPDIEFPSAFDPSKIGESSLDTALPWDQIRSLRFQTLDTPKNRIRQLIEMHQARIANDPNFTALLQRTERAKQLSSSESTSLQLELRQEERAVNERILLAIENTRRTALGIDLAESVDDIEILIDDKKTEDDASVMESARILVDDIALTRRPADL